MTRPKLTEESWRRVFKIQCAGKRGEYIAPADHKLCARAIKADPERYRRQAAEAFRATAPFGSRVE